MIRCLLMTALAFVVAAAAPAGARDFAPLDADSIIVCPAAGGSDPPDFSEASCRKATPDKIDPQGRMIWVKAQVVLTDAILTDPRPLGLVVSGKGAREIWLNEHYLGADGRPAATKTRETPGRMDAAFYVSKDLVRSGRNDIVLLMSAHHGFLKLVYPVHVIGIGPYAVPQDFLLRGYWPSLLTFGVFAIGFFYFGVMSVLRRDPAGSILLTLMSFFAGAQLLTEVLRAFWAYPYPFHDVRLAMIVIFSLGFGLCLTAHIAVRFLKRGRVAAIAGVVFLTAIVISLTPGFDGKAAGALLAPTLLSATAALWWTIEKRPAASRYFTALCAFAAAIIIFSAQFLDSVFFFAVAALLVFLFAQQALALARAEEQRRRDEERARRLERALHEAQHADRNGRITIRTGGRLEFIQPERISHCNGAGDYVELRFHDGGAALHNGSLNELEKDLPPVFLRVHRSHIVNTNMVKALFREASGVGRLEMKNGASVPVSRRIMPKVKSVLG
ncbi:MAG: LytTR family DNA-binding domain-containing protein [Amphiplicatus sp.]